METNDELTGSYVLIHPDLYFDPVAKQGYTGLVTHADAAGDEFYVSFGKQTALYAGDSLMVLQKSNDIYVNAMDNVKNLSTEEFKDLLKISMMVANGQLKDQKTALEMASANPSLRAHALLTVEDKYNRQLNAAEAMSAEMSTGRGR